MKRKPTDLRVVSDDALLAEVRRRKVAVVDLRAGFGAMVWRGHPIMTWCGLISFEEWQKLVRH